MEENIFKDELDPEYTRVTNEMERMVEEACLAAGHKKIRVIYSAYEVDWWDNPINNLKEVAVRGRVILIQPRSDFWGDSNGKNYVSKVLTDPTWLDVCVCANRSIFKTRDRHHVFLEGLNQYDNPKLPSEKTIRLSSKYQCEVYYLLMGS